MPKICAVTGKKKVYGNRVSHAKNRTSRVFEVNLQNVALKSEGLGYVVRFRSSTNGLRTIEKFGGLDAFLLKSKNRKLTPEFLKLKKKMLKRSAKLNNATTN